MISTHCFMLPFKWDYIPNKYDPQNNMYSVDYDTRTSLDAFNRLLSKGKWKRNFYRINNDPKAYNEITYYHAHVANIIFDLQQADEHNEYKVNTNKSILYYEIEENESDYYKICTTHKEYKLQIKGISLHVANTGVAILTFNLVNNQYTEPFEILEINELGRRIYPQFLGDSVPYTKATKGVFLAEKIEIKVAKVDNGLSIIEDFTSYDNLYNKETHRINALGHYEHNTIIEFPNFISRLFPNAFVFSAKDELKYSEKISCKYVTDDRMFFHCWYGNGKLSDQMAIKEKDVFSVYTHPFWYAFINGDKNQSERSIYNDEMMALEIDRASYLRWLTINNYFDDRHATLYGFSRDSFVCLGGWEQTKKHMNTMYYQMAVLGLLQRASVLRFSAEVSVLTDLGKIKGKEEETCDKIKNLYLNYIEFINKIYFREITPQIQGIEMYNKLQEVMNIHKDVKDLDGEIKELHEFAMMLRQEIQTNEAYILTRLAAIFLPSTLIFSILGANFFEKYDWVIWGVKPNMVIWLWISFGLFPILISSIYFFKKSIITYLKKYIHV